MFEERGKRVIRTPMPRNFKIDILVDDVGDTPVKDIINRAEDISVGRRKANRIKVVSLEDLIILKHRAAREQDNEDLYYIANTKFSKINWSLLQSLTKDEVEFSNIKNTMNLNRNRKINKYH